MASIFRLKLTKIKGSNLHGVTLKASCAIVFSENVKKLGLRYKLKVLLFDKDASFDILNPYINGFFYSHEIDNFDISSLPSELQFDDPITSTDHKKYIIDESFDLENDTFFKIFNSKDFILQDKVINDKFLLSDKTLKALRDDNDARLEIYAIALLSNEIGGLIMKKSGVVNVDVIDIINN